MTTECVAGRRQVVGMGAFSKSSNHWKNISRFFQSLETFVHVFPTIGKKVKRVGTTFPIIGCLLLDLMAFASPVQAQTTLRYSLAPVLTNGSTTNLIMITGVTNTFTLSAADGVYYCVKISNTTADVQCRLSPDANPDDATNFTNGFGWYCESPGTYRLDFSVTSATPCSLTLIGLKMPTPADYSALDWTNAFLAAHAKFSREYAFTEWKSIDWSAMYSNTLPLIEQAQAETNEQAYYAALHAYVGAIPDGHVRLSATNYTVPNAWADAVAGGGYGLALAELDDGRVIAAALVTNGPAQNAGIQTGAEILDWGGITITSALAQIKVSDYPLKALATTMEIDPQATLDHYRLEQVRLMVRGPIGTNVEVRFLNPGAESTQTVTLVSEADSNTTFSLVNFAWRQDLYADPVDYEILTNGLGYVVLRIEESLTDPSDISGIYNAFAEAIGTFVTSNVSGVIVDLRGNFGGRDDLAAMLSGFFYTSNAFYEGQEWYNEVDGQFTRITLDETGEYPYLDHLSITPQPVCYRGPVAVLVNPGTISSGEGVTMGIGRLPNTRVIGFYGTDGSFGLCGGSITLPGGYTIQYPYGRSLNEEWNIQIDSRNGVGGVPPEIRVPKTVENVLAFAAGTDVELNIASEYLLDLPELPVGQTVTGTLAVGESITYRFTITEPVWHGVYVTPREPALYQPLSDLSTPGVYSLVLQNPGTSTVSYTARIYNLTNTIAQVEAYINGVLPTVPAMSIALVDGSQLAWAEGFGMQNREDGIPAHADTIYRIASMSKAFASMSVLKLQEAGALNLSDNITNTISSFALLPRYTNQNLTIRSILAHDCNIPGTYYKNSETTVQMTNYYETVLHSLAQDYFVNPPGFIALYNNNGVTLVEGVVPGATNTNYRQYLTDQILTPMSLSNTVFTLSEEQHQRLARFYRGSELMPDEYVNAFASGGLYSSVVDLSRWMRFLLGYGTYDSVTVISSNSMEAIWTPQASHVKLSYAEHFLDFGLGWDNVGDPQFAYASSRACWKNGGAEGYGSFVLVIPEQQLGVVVLSSFSGDSFAQPAARLAMKSALEEARGLFAPTNTPVLPTTPVHAMSTDDVAGIVGHYANGSGYDLVAGDTNGLTWTHAAQSASPQVHSNLLLHADGWYYTDEGTPAFQLMITNVEDRTFLRERVVLPTGMDTFVIGERFTPNVLSSAWSNRTAKTWMPSDLEPESLYWFLGTDLRMSVTIHDGVLLASGFSGHAALQPQSDTLAFPFSINSTDVYAMQVRETNGCEILHYGGFNYRAIEDMPELQVGITASGSIAAAESAFYTLQINAPVYHNLYVTPGLDYSLFTVPDWSVASDLSSTGQYVLAIHSDSNTSYQVRLYTFTSTIARVTTLVTNLIEQNNLVGCGFSFVDGTNTILETGFGYADKERGIAADENTVFMIGSCSKTFGALAAMQLVEEGRLDLDASITNALPDFTIHQRFANNVITPRTILTHHSGLPGDLFNEGFTVYSLPTAPDAVQAMLADEYTLMPTNTMWAYNNSGFVMLGQMFRHITGQELDVFARERLFDRMGMTNSSIAYNLPCIQENLAHPYINGVVQPDEYVNLFFAGAIYSTASDMARYMRMLLAGGQGDNARVVSNETLRAMSVKQNADIPLDQYVSLLNQGIGFLLDPLNLQYMGKVIWHDGSTVYFRTLMRVATDAQLGCFISCNSYEGAVLNYTVVDAALQWAYEEKTGITLPAPLDPGTPAEAIPPPDVLALATNGVFVTGDGYDRFRYDGTHLFARFNAQSDDSAESMWIYRENGWFTPTNAYAPQLSFTQSVGRILSLLQMFDQPVTNLTLRGERSADIDGFDPAWNNRLGRWWAIDLHPDDIAWHGDDLRLAWPMLNLYERENMLLIQAEDLYVMSATNDALAFAAGLGRNKGSSLRASAGNTLAFMGVIYGCETNIPVLMPCSSTNGITSGNETCWFRIPPAASPVTLDLISESDMTAFLYTENDSYLGQANRAHAFHLDAAGAQPILAAILRNGTNAGPWTLVVRTNAVPFYSQVPPADWPDYLVTHSNLYGDLEFGYVYVHENRTNQTGNLTKLAVAQMKSTNAVALPYFFCHGGPGTSSIHCTLQPFLRTFTDEFDVYLLDQRGINFSQPDLTLRTDETLRQCQYRVGMLEEADLSAVNTGQSAYDIADVAAAFQLTNVNLHGFSYGSLLAQNVLRLEPDWLRSVILDGVVAPNIPFVDNNCPVHYNAHRAFCADVDADPTNAVLYPDLLNTFYELASDLTNQPVDVYIDGAPVTIDGFKFVQAVEMQLGVSEWGNHELIPNVIWRAAHGETQALAELFTAFHGTPDDASSVMMSALLSKHDIMPFVSMSNILSHTGSVPDIDVQANVRLAEELNAMTETLDPCGQADNTFTNPVVSSIPALVINGIWDTQCGTNWAAEVASHLPNGHLVLTPTVGHGNLFGGECPREIMRAFVCDPWAAPDTSCLAGMTVDFPPPWSTNAEDAVLDAPVTNSFAAPNSGTWYRFNAVSGLVYTVQQLPVQLTLSVLNGQADLIAAGSGGSLSWQSPYDGAQYLWLVASQTGAVESTLEVPILLRSMAMTNGQLNLSWQSLTNDMVDLWYTTNLLDSAVAIRLQTNLSAQGWFTTYRLDPAPTGNTVNVFYLKKP